VFLGGRAVGPDYSMRIEAGPGVAGVGYNLPTGPSDEMLAAMAWAHDLRIDDPVQAAGGDLTPRAPAMRLPSYCEPLGLRGLRCVEPE
jgi:hypothetical protein